jgi:hypothetical protein
MSASEAFLRLQVSDILYSSGQFPSRGHVTTSGDVCACHNTGQNDAVGPLWVKPKVLLSILKYTERPLPTVVTRFTMSTVLRLRPCIGKQRSCTS